MLNRMLVNLCINQQPPLPTLPQIPVKIPPGMSTEQAEAVLEMLKSNPELAKAASAQAQAMLQMPGFAQMLNAAPDMGSQAHNQQVRD